jgi:hypothetical protein
MASGEEGYVEKRRPTNQSQNGSSDSRRLGGRRITDQSPKAPATRLSVTVITASVNLFFYTVASIFNHCSFTFNWF